MKTFISFFLLMLVFSCSSSNSTQPNYDPPADHTIKKGGAFHKSGLNTPQENCVSCHGTDLRGGDAPSCYTCHGKKW